MTNDFIVSLRKWRFWMLDAWLDHMLPHRQSIFGALWLLFPTALFVGIVGTIFGHIVEPGVDFYLYMLTGLVIWAPINHALTGAGNCYGANRAFILIGGLPLPVFNLKLIFHSFLQFVTQFILILIAWLILMPTLSFELIYVFPAVVLLFLFLLPMSIAISLIGARYNDFAEATRAVQRILFLATPIIWTASVDQERFQALSPFLFLNPFFFALELIRSPIIGAPINHSYWIPLVGYVFVTWVIGILCYRVLARETPLWI